MASVVRIPLGTSDDQYGRLLALQQAFAQVCNELAPIVQERRVWNRVALHHLAYKDLRRKFPQLGSQMVCNAIYSVSRTSRLVFQTPSSPFHLSRMSDRPLPRLRFTDASPVYFDRHTLSLKDGRMSMYTLDGRMKFQVSLQPEAEQAFRHARLLELVLQRQGRQFDLTLTFEDENNAEQEGPRSEEAETAARDRAAGSGQKQVRDHDLPAYVVITE